MSADVILQAVRVSKRYGADVVLDDVTLTVRRGETVCLLGPSGAGKTTFLRCLNHLERPTSGAVFLDNELLGYQHSGQHLVELSAREVARQRRAIGMVFQSFNLFTHMSVLQNVTEAPIRVLGRERAKAVQTAREVLAAVGMDHKEAAMPHELSGGQQQRVAIARALAMHPKVVLFDEPTSALDPEMVSEVLDTMRKLADMGTTMIVVTHEVGFAREVAARAVFMEDGKIVEEGSADEVLRRSQNQRTRNFLAKVL